MRVLSVVVVFSPKYFCKLLFSHPQQWDFLDPEASSRPVWDGNIRPSATIENAIWTRTVTLVFGSAHLFGAKQLPELMMTYCQLEHTWVKFEESQSIPFREINLNLWFTKWRPFCSGEVSWLLHRPKISRYTNFGGISMSAYHIA